MFVAFTGWLAEAGCCAYTAIRLVWRYMARREATRQLTDCSGPGPIILFCAVCLPHSLCTQVTQGTMHFFTAFAFTSSIGLRAFTRSMAMTLVPHMNTCRLGRACSLLWCCMIFSLFLLPSGPRPSLHSDEPASQRLSGNRGLGFRGLGFRG